MFLRAFFALFLVVALAFPSQALAGSGPKGHGHKTFRIIKRAIIEAVKNYPLRNIAKVHIIVFGFAYPCAESSQGEVRLLTG